MPLVANHEQVGMIREFAGSLAPAGYLLCDGSVLNRTAYPGLFSVIGTTWNTGGETTSQFRLPDFRGKVLIGHGQDTTRSMTARTVGTYLGAETSSLTSTNLPGHTHSAGTMGTESVTHTHSALSTTVNLAHQHNYPTFDPQDCVDGQSHDQGTGDFADNLYTSEPNTIAHGHSGYSNGRSSDHTHPITTGSGDSITGASHENRQPYLALNVYIKY